METILIELRRYATVQLRLSLHDLTNLALSGTWQHRRIRKYHSHQRVQRIDGAMPAHNHCTASLAKWERTLSRFSV
jgi:hypothetical protein